MPHSAALLRIDIDTFLEHHGIAPAEMHCTMQACRLTLGEHQTGLARRGADLSRRRTRQDQPELRLVRRTSDARPDRIRRPRRRSLLAHLQQGDARAGRAGARLRNPDDGHPCGRADATARFSPRHRRPRQADRRSARRTIRHHGRVRQGVCRLRPCDLGCRVRPIDAEREDQPPYDAPDRKPNSTAGPGPRSPAHFRRSAATCAARPIIRPSPPCPSSRPSTSC